MGDSWIDKLDLRRDSRATFTVTARKYGDDPITGRRKWREVGVERRLRTPLTVRRAILEQAEMLGVGVDWTDVLPRMAALDWLTAAVIARQERRPLPKLPGADRLTAQRSLKTFGRVTLGAAWGYELQCLSTSFEQWVRILGGQKYFKEMPYHYEGRRCHAWWSFDGHGGLRVTIDVDGTGYPTGEGWVGHLQDLAFIEGPQLDGEDLAKLTLAGTIEPDD